MKRFAYLDIEATHTNWHDAEIIEIAFIIKDESGKELDFFQSLIRPQKEINEDITELTGITARMLSSAPEFNRVAKKIIDKLNGCIIVAHKAEFDCQLLQKELAPLGLNLNHKSICTLKLSQRLIPELKSYSLEALCNMLFINNHKRHRALGDAEALMQLHLYLRMLSGELTEREQFLEEHKKLIQRTITRPGVIQISLKDNEIITQQYFKTDNLQKKLMDLLELNPRNKVRLTQLAKIKIHEASSLTEASLILTNLQKDFYPYCIYKVKEQSGRERLRIGRTNLKKKALFYFKDKKEAQLLIRSITKNISKKNFIYQDSSDHPSEVVKENINLNKELRKHYKLEKNFLIRSEYPIGGKYQYILIKGNKSYSRFETKKLITNSDELSTKSLKLRPIGPRESTAFNHSLQWIKNQRQKTDILLEVKASL
tara:strand:- start:127886 stop:129169 length:1284 start_codon:yes stop_codon:yes gene_type:complete